MVKGTGTKDIQMVTCNIVKATRELIESLMAKDTHNRNKSRSHVEYLKREIREGKWFPTNQGIGITASGFVADGGHRIVAMWEAEAWKYDVRFLLVEGLDDRAQLYVDRGRGRTMSDVLKLFYDTTVSTAVAACVNVLLRAYRAAWRNSWAEFEELEIRYTNAVTDKKRPKNKELLISPSPQDVDGDYVGMGWVGKDGQP
jgi:hypothetical protein